MPTSARKSPPPHLLAFHHPQEDSRPAPSAEEAARWRRDGLIGRSACFGQMVRSLRRVQDYPNTNVMLYGESGTGKELVARAIHFGGPHAAEAFVPVNCSALPEHLAESLLFGHTRGAFTGAVADRQGYFELAHRGTLFLDEIGDMPLPVQAKLLRVLEDGQVTPLGATRSVAVQTRIVAATHVDLSGMIAAGKFRQDLYFRLMHFPLTLAPLRERRDDIPELAAHFLHRFASESNRPTPRLHPAALQRLQAWSYPGNVRELKNTVERAMIHAEGAEILARHIVFLPAGATEGPNPVLGNVPKHHVSSANSDLSLDTFPYNLAQAEELLIARALQAAAGNITEAARLLGVNRSRIYRQAKAFEIKAAA